MANEQKKPLSKGVVTPTVAGVAGAVVGASVGVAAAVAMKDEKNRKAAQKVINAVKDQAVGYAENMMEEAKNDPRVKEVTKLVEEQKSSSGAPSKSGRSGAKKSQSSSSKK